MGFFSQECSRCNKSILSNHSTNPTNDWMKMAVVILPNDPGNPLTRGIIQGEYNGYGQVADWEDVIGDKNQVYHLACWNAAGMPRTNVQASEHSEDQGFFFDEEDYNFANCEEAYAKRDYRPKTVWDNA